MQGDAQNSAPLPPNGRAPTNGTRVTPTVGAHGATNILPTSCGTSAPKSSLPSPPPISPIGGKVTTGTNCDTSPATCPDFGRVPTPFAAALARALPSAPPEAGATRSYEERKAIAQAARRREQQKRAWLLCGAPARQRKKSVDGCDPHPQWMEARRKVLVALAAGGIVALIGSPGSGKTQIAVEAIMADIREHAKPSRYEVLADAFATIRQAYGPAATRSEMSLINDYALPHLLVLDEIDKRGGADGNGTISEQRLLHRIIDKRYGAGLPTLLIGNVDGPDALGVALDGFGGEGVGPLFDRLRETGGIVEAFGWSFREGGKPAP
jgi:DNA replication protein DnaC